jgi:asparagine synthase (glutamine-hydrolysing)
MSIFTRDELDELYQPDFANRLSAGPATDSIAGTWNRSAARDLVDVMLDVDVRTYLPGDLLVKVDIATMAHSLEVRSPFLDHVLMERAARLPSALKLRGRETKALLRTAMRPWLPEAVIRRGKMGFGVPLFWWFRHGLAHLPAAVLLDPRALDRGIFRPSAIRGLIDDHRAARRDNSAKLWSLLALELWFQTYIDAAGTRPVSLSSGG